MKKLKFLVLALIVAAPIMVNAAEPNVLDADNLASCLSKDSTVNTCVLGADIPLTSTIEIKDGVSKTLDLNGYDITGTFTSDDLFYISNGSLVVENSSTTVGTIWGKGDGIGGAFYLQGNSTPGGDPIPAELTIGKNVSVISNTSNCIYIRGNGAKATVNGSLESKGNLAAIQGNGTVNSSTDHGNTEITINTGAVITAARHAIYHPQSGTLTVNGGTITGNTGIEMRSGDLIVNGGTITSTAAETTITANGNGPAVYGVGIALAQHTTLQATSITVNGGTISGPTALVEATPENPSDATVVALSVTGGTFESTVEGGNAVSSENKTEFITGGTYIGLVNESYVEDNENHGFVENENGEQILIDATELNALAKELEEKVGTEEKANQYTEESLNALLAVLEELETELDAVQSQEDVDAIVEKLAKAIDGLETPEEAAKREEAKNPDTGDNIVTYVLVATVSVLLVSVSLILKRRYN